MGAENQVKVALQGLDGAVAELSALSADISAQLDELEQSVSQLHIQWSGVAADAHRQAHAEWITGARLMSDGVQRMQQAAASTHAAFSSAAQANRSLFS